MKSVGAATPKAFGVEIIQPRVARNELPWDSDPKIIFNPNGVASAFHTH
jgi:hypothetical protein